MLRRIDLSSKLENQIKFLNLKKLFYFQDHREKLGFQPQRIIGIYKFWKYSQIFILSQALKNLINFEGLRFYQE